MRHVIVAVLIACFVQACAITTNKPLGAANVFDQSTYDALIVSQAAIEEAKLELPKFPQFKAELNQAITSYNTAMSLYKTYHSAVITGGNPDRVALIDAVTKVQDLVSKLLQKLKPNNAPAPAPVARLPHKHHTVKMLEGTWIA